MDENKAELLKLLFTRIGMIMEDENAVALELGAPSSQFEPEKIAELCKAVKAITALTDAARLIAE